MSDFSRLLQIRNRKLTAQRQAERRMADLCAYCRREVNETRQAMENYMEEIKTLEIDLLTELVNTELKAADFKQVEARLKEAEEKAAALSQAHIDATDKLGRFCRKDLAFASRHIECYERVRQQMQDRSV